MSGLGVLLWIIVPYVAIATFVLGHVWRYRYDKFGWTTRSSQLYESRLLRLGSPLFHFGILLVIAGHLFGILVPEAATGAAGISEHAYHVVAVALGSVSGFMTVAGLAILIYRRRVTGPVFSATTRNDKAMYVLLTATIVAGLSTTVLGNLLGHHLQLPADDSAVLPQHLLRSSGHRPDQRGAHRLQDPRAARLGALRRVAVHPPGARLQRTGRISHPALHRLPVPGRRRMRSARPGAAGSRSGAPAGNRPPCTVGRRGGPLIMILGRMVAMGTGADGGQARSLSRTASAIRDLHPGYFAFVMATGIISTGTFLLGPSWLSRVLLAAASIGLVVLSAALVIRLAIFRSSVIADIQAPERVFGFFTIAAGIDVLGVRFGAAGHPLATAILAGVAAVVWLTLTYGVPASLLLARERDSVLGGVNGSWLLWVVGTQSLSVAASTLVPAWPSQSGLLAPAAVGLWSVGLVLYLLLVSLILLRWLTVAMTPATLGPPYWILMGATAITVLAGARILNFPAALPVTRATAGFVEGFSFTLWAFGTWWIPLLIVLGLWRHVRRHWPLTYEPTLWSVVFPLGMYSVATLSFGKVAHLRFMEPLGRFMLWVAVAAWVLVAIAFLARLARQPGKPASGAPAPSASATTTAT